jgi:predicted nucleic acid-binding protein
MSDKTFLDTGILVGALLLEHPEHASCAGTVSGERDVFTDLHCLAEVFATLTGFYKVPNAEAAELTLSLCETLAVEPLTLQDYRTAIGEARQRGVMGGGIYDSLHATVARRRGAKRIATRNPGHFAHVAPEMQILTP